MCPNITNPEEFLAGGSGLENNERIIEIYVYPCSLPDKSKCGSEEVADSLQIFWNEASTLFDYSDTKSPISKNMKMNTPIKIDRYQTYISTLTVRQNIIQDNIWDFLPSFEKERFLDFESKQPSSKIRNSKIPTTCDLDDILSNEPNCSPYFMIEIFGGSNTRTFDRKYTSIIQIMSDVGGFYQAALLAGSLVYVWYNSRSLNNYLKSVIIKRDSKDLHEYFLDTKPKDLEKIISEVIESRQSASKLFEMIGIFEVLEELIFEDYHISLLPLIQIKKAQAKKAQEERLEKIKTQKQNRVNSKTLGDEEVEKSQEELLLDLKESIKQLKASQSEDPLTRRIDSLFMKYIRKGNQGNHIEEIGDTQQSNMVEFQRMDLDADQQLINTGQMLFKKGSKRRVSKKINKGSVISKSGHFTSNGSKNKVNLAYI